MLALSLIASSCEMSVLSEQWLQDVADSMGLPALNPTIVNMMLPVIEVQLKKITQQAHKFQRRAKSKTLAGACINITTPLSYPANNNNFSQLRM